jgi:uncharacterized protein (DUF1015 family)
VIESAPLVRPFRGLRPAPGREAEVIAPPYDVLSSSEARARARGRPFSFLHVSKAEIDLPVETDPHAPQVYARAAHNLAQFVSAGVLVRDPQPCYYAYRLVMAEHSQIGLAATASIAAYRRNRIRRHEHTLPAKEIDRVRQIEAVNAQTGPVLMAYPQAAAVDAALAHACAGAPDSDALADDGIRHTLWVIRDPSRIRTISAALAALPALYIADGHHRSAAAARVAAARGGDGEASHQYFLAVLFPQHAMRILDYNRVLADLNGLAPAQLLERLTRCCTVEPMAARGSPRAPAEFTMYLERRWYRLQVRSDRIPADDPVARLDVSLLTDLVLAPIFGVQDLRRDPRIDFVGGIRGIAELERRVDEGRAAVAFAMYPTPMAALVAVADSGAVMPPKSTWFEPKLADGLISHVLD